MSSRKNNYVSADLDWAEQQLATWRTYVDEHPINELTDRIEQKYSANGASSPMVIASIEAQGKFIQETMKNYLSLLEIVEKLREADDRKKISARGNTGLTPFEEGDI